MRNEPLGVYFHIPFCRERCAYCDFCSNEKWDEPLLDRYLSALLDHLDRDFPRGRRVDTVYIGGGTPSVFGGGRIARLLDRLGALAALDREAEITVEVNPESVTEELLRRLKAAGVNRISMGVQSAHDRELALLGRIHTFAQAERAAGLCHRLCTENLSLDLMLGLPGQTMEGWLDSLEAVCRLEPAHLSCYLLKLEEGTPLFRQNPALPDDGLQAELYLAAVDFLAARGYEQYEISNFARTGRASRHNQKYWDLSEYLGFGPSAHSLYGGKRFFYENGLQGYLSGERKPVFEPEDRLSQNGRLGEYLMLALRTAKGIGEEELSARWGRDFAPFARRLEPYRRAGFACRENDRWRLTPKGFLVSNRILSEVLEAL